MQAVLTATLTSPIVTSPPPVGARIWRRLRATVEEGGSADTVATWARAYLPGPDAEAVTRRLAVLDLVAECLKRYEDEGILVVTEFDRYYPQRWHERLGDRRPALLFVVGRRSLLASESIGVVGSRDVDEAGRAFARQVAAEAVSRGRTVISGGARGVDQAAMQAALDQGGTTVGFVAESLRAVASRPATRECLEDARICLATPFSPSAGFSAGNALGRNRLIYAHGSATVVVAAAGGRGGTWSGATEALERGLCPVLVRLGSGVPEGNERLVAAGGIAITSPHEIWEHRPKERREVEQGLLF